MVNKLLHGERIQANPYYSDLIDYDTSLLKLTEKLEGGFANIAQNIYIVNSQGCLEGSKTAFGIVLNKSEAKQIKNKQFVQSDHFRSR